MRQPASLHRLDAAIASAHHDLARQRDDALAALAARLGAPAHSTGTAPPATGQSACQSAPTALLRARVGGRTSASLDREAWSGRAVLAALAALLIYVCVPDRSAQDQQAIMVNVVTWLAGFALALMSWVLVRMLWDPQ